MSLSVMHGRWTFWVVSVAIKTINIHVNCSDGEPWEIADRFAANLATLSDSVRSRLVVENEDKGIWNVERLVKYFYNRHGIPITYDNLHDKCNPSDVGIYDCVATWGKYKPLFHYSESHPDKSILAVMLTCQQIFLLITFPLQKLNPMT